MASAKFQRWAVFSAGFQYKLEYLKGTLTVRRIYFRDYQLRKNILFQLIVNY